MSRDYEIIARRSKPGRFVELHEVDYRFRQRDGTLTAQRTDEVMVPRDASAVLAFHPDQDRVLLISQFRVATARNVPNDGWLLELPAGGIKAGETPLEAACREFEAETGYELSGRTPGNGPLSRFKPIATIDPSPGLSAERIHIFYLELDTSDKVVRPAGEPGEEIRVVWTTTDELSRGLDAGSFSDAKLIVAAQWFRAKENKAYASPPSGEDEIAYTFSEDSSRAAEKKRRIIIRRGNIKDMTNVDIWVNSENTDMLMARFFEPSVSGTIRYLGAEKLENGAIYRDTVADLLKSRLGGDIFVKPGDVVVTRPGQLRKSPYCVRWLFHAAAVHGRVGRGLYSDPRFAADCVLKSLQLAEAMNGSWRPWRRPLRSIVFPMLGAGQGGRSPDEIAGAMIPEICDFLRSTPETRLNRIYLLGFNQAGFNAFRAALDKQSGLVSDKSPGPLT